LVGVGVFLSCSAFLFWLEAYPNADDPKNIDYVLWKHGLNANMNLDAALLAMVHDSWPVARVANLSKEQLEKRFGYIRSMDTATQLGHCFSSQLLNHPKANDAVSLRNSLWIVTLENGKAVDIIYCKCC
jgi:hypothetical protein